MTRYTEACSILHRIDLKRVLEVRPSVIFERTSALLRAPHAETNARDSRCRWDCER